MVARPPRGHILRVLTQTSPRIIRFKDGQSVGRIGTFQYTAVTENHAAYGLHFFFAQLMYDWYGHVKKMILVHIWPAAVVQVCHGRVNDSTANPVAPVQVIVCFTLEVPWQRQVRLAKSDILVPSST